MAACGHECVVQDDMKVLGREGGNMALPVQLRRARGRSQMGRGPRLGWEDSDAKRFSRKDRSPCMSHLPSPQKIKTDVLVKVTCRLEGQRWIIMSVVLVADLFVVVVGVDEDGRDLLSPRAGGPGGCCPWES